MKNIIYIIAFLFAFTANISAQNTIVSGKYTAKKHRQRIKTFTASKGELVQFNITSLHKKKGVNLWVIQHPGNLTVLNYEDFTSGTKTVYAPADAIYEVLFSGRNVDCNIEITNSSSGNPSRGDIVYVRIPDTLHTSGYVNRSIGESYTLTPYKEKIILSKKKQPEQIISRDFFTGVDYINVDIPGNIKDEYREQKLLSYSVTLTCGEVSMYNAMMGVVDAGIDLALDKVGGKIQGKLKKTKKGSQNDQYNFTNKDLDDESDKMETISELVEIGGDAADEFAPESKEGKLLDTIGFVLDGGIKEVAIEKAMDAAGVPQNIQAIYGKIQEFPPVGDIVKDNVHKLIPKVKGKARIIVDEKRIVTKKYPVIPQKEFWIQSAMNYGKNQGGCLDVPGSPTVGKKGQNIKVWNIDAGADRKFKLVPSEKYQGHYEIHSVQTGNVVLDVSNGEINKNGANIQLWERNKSDAQQFLFQHLGGGKFKIKTVSHAICLDNRKNANGTNVHLWEDQNGPWMEWYLVDPVTKKAFVPTTENPYRIWERHTALDKTGGVISETVKVDSTIGKSQRLYITVGKQGVEAKAKLLVEAEYEITDYTDVVKYKRTTQAVKTKDFWTAYKVRYDYQIMFKDQVKEGWQIIPKGEFFSSARPKSEVVKSDDYSQKARLAKYNLLTKNK